ncbi:NAD(P)/FAD-dependent oxidoreductase [Mycobacterium sp. CVI_P3]|uniref:Pyridine nucleotide-disulfide oxidoreductase domain-containing protein 2 n=1 Tax=Mycobacterium pinniadriaticum TaxID=2994102 RepID=A0ABT3SBS7_9MYCO|nr:NAD(P)/FAD-dependent oxidoreductase [Mycobacterium pinniadriaticum]MCX2929981.1 NAD(P)/FAD-dependent oxidoreductase [Mycobacterium pinniadriaticum]MCX2936370.1 NAD(P)/FAD-dependent oxidoreductase [Mycobacterium pinniadriaticum]
MSRDDPQADVLIVGAGHNGLTAGCYLARAGLKVLVVESSPAVGGMTSTNTVLAGAPQHRINEGAMDSSLWRTTTIARDLDLARYGLRELDIGTPYAFLDGDGSSLCIHRDPVRTAEEVGRFNRADGRAYLELANALEAAMNIAVPYMNSNPLRPALPEIASGALRSARHPRRFGPLTEFLTTSQAEFIDSRFTDHRIKSLLAAVPCFAPISADGTAWVLIYFGLIHRVGVGRFQGGTGAVTDALARCFADAGGSVRLDAPVESLVIRGGRACGVQLESGEQIYARSVVTTTNAATVLGRWLPDGVLPDRLAQRVPYIPTSSTHASSFKIDIALSGRAELSNHQINRRDDVDLRRPALCLTTFDDHVAAWSACARGAVADPLPGFAILPTGMDTSQAPDGQDTFWFWSGISPAHPARPWPELAGPTAQSVLGDVAKYIDGLEKLEIERRVMTPEDIEARFRAPDGNVYHVDPIATRFGPLRPLRGAAGYRTPVDGLFLSGASTHPSAGICGIPGQQAARAVLRARKGWMPLRGRASR